MRRCTWGRKAQARYRTSRARRAPAGATCLRHCSTSPRHTASRSQTGSLRGTRSPALAYTRRRRPPSCKEGWAQNTRARICSKWGSCCLPGRSTPGLRTISGYPSWHSNSPQDTARRPGFGTLPRSSCQAHPRTHRRMSCLHMISHLRLSQKTRRHTCSHFVRSICRDNSTRLEHTPWAARHHPRRRSRAGSLSRSKTARQAGSSCPRCTCRHPSTSTTKSPQLHPCRSIPRCRAPLLAKMIPQDTSGQMRCTVQQRRGQCSTSPRRTRFRGVKRCRSHRTTPQCSYMDRCKPMSRVLGSHPTC
jgi:hypothetical protein